MKEKANELDEMTRVQRELDSMAQEVPEMPEEFRRAWRLAIREEAANHAVETEKTLSDDVQEGLNRTAAVHSEKGRDTGEKNISYFQTRRWTGILSAAAAMIFLIGGTLATRNSLSPRLQSDRARATEWPAEGNLVSETLLPPADMLNNSLDMALNAKGMTLEVPLSQGAEEAEEKATETDAESGTEAETVPKETANTDTAGKADEPAASEKNSFWTEVGFFFEDMGAFLKASLPYLIGIGAAAVILLLVRKIKRK